jgi:pSer/pThr/pTyr-binding forkhead associated (FHA) protein
MALTVVVRSADVPSLTFDGARVVIGRGSGCDIRLPDPSVSHRHASIRTDAGDHTVIDEGSHNGTFVGGIRLAPRTPRVIRSGDLVRIGRVWLEIRIDQQPATRDLAMATRDLALALVADAMRALGDDVVPKARAVEGPDTGAVLELAEEGRSYVLGRGETCDLALADTDASREHVQLVRRGSVVLVRDLGSKNGIFLGDTRVQPGRDVAWKPALMLRLAGTVLALEEPVAVALAELEASEDEPLAEEDVPAVPLPSVVAPPASTRDLAARPGPGDAASPAAAPAPIAQIDRSSTTVPGVSARRRSGWTATDITVIAAALLVLAASGAGLYWLLRG